MQTVTVEVVGKYGVMVNGQWFGLKKPLKPSNLQAGKTYEIETEGWEAKGKSGTNIVSFNEPKTTKEVTGTNTKQETKTKTKDEPAIRDYEQDKNRRILVQGIVQAVAQSPSLAGVPFTNTDEVVENVKRVSEALIEFVLERSK